MELEGKKKTAPETPAKDSEPPGISDVEKRLAGIRQQSRPRVTYGPTTVVPAVAPLAAGDVGSLPGGTGGAAALLTPAQAGSLQALPSGPLSLATQPFQASPKVRADPPGDKARPMKVADALTAAATARSADPSKKRKRSRSQTRRKRKKKKKRKGSPGGTDSSDDSSSTSSSRSLMAPLKRRSERSPGSVFQMLEDQAFAHLAQDGVLDEGGDVNERQKPRLFTYFQLCLKPHLDMRGRDGKEMAMLARGLDLLKSGRLAELADLLAGRMIAVDTSTRQGWGTARHLEVFSVDDGATAPPHILLAAQRHSQQVERAGGKGSWRGLGSWSNSDWSGGSGAPKGKGKDAKGKTKKGKGKGKTWKTYGGKDDGGESKQKPAGADT